MKDVRMQNSIAEYYHEQTKYTPDGLSRSGKRLDFDQQPVPFKDYASEDRVDLVPYLPEDADPHTDAELAADRAAVPASERLLAELSHLFYFTNGITAVIPYGDTPFMMRAAPSAGGLYPTELYLAVRRHSELPDGLYNYQVRDHALVRFWGQDPWPKLQAACFDNPALAEADMAVVFTGVFFRSAWRYEDRAYRRIMLDTGHVLGNLTAFAPCIDRHVAPIGGFNDDALNELLFLDAETEAAIAVAALLPSGTRVDAPTALPGERHPRRDIGEGQRIYALHEAGKLTTAPATPAATPTDAAAGGDKYAVAFAEPFKGLPFTWDSQLAPTILHRRSTRSFTGEPLTRAELATMLEFTYRPDLVLAEACHEPRPGYFTPHLLETFVAVNDVEGLDPGCYHYAPAKRELRQIRFTALRDEVRYLSLGQELAGRAGAVVFHTADLPRAVERYGDRAYRYLHLDAGHLGQRLNLAAIRMGLGVSGIGGFFDDQVNDLLGIPEREAVLYITTLGRPARSQA
jgi:SagB-type dehydrogenase family enzyme